MELARWPQFARQILKDNFAAELGRLVGGRSHNADGRAAGKNPGSGKGLGRLLQNVLSKTKSELENLKLSEAEDTEEKLNRVLATKRLSANSLPYLLRLLAADGVLQVHARQDLQLAQRLSDAFSIPVSVYSSAVRDQWATRAAREFLAAIERVGRHVWKNKRHNAAADSGGKAESFLNIGLVGGSTVELLIERLQESRDWEQDFGVSPRAWGSIRILALNVCLTRPDRLSSNANVLVNGLCRAIKRQVSKTGGKVEGHGLLATLTVPTDKPAKYDEDTRRVLEITDPSMLSKQPGDSPSGSQLNLVLTSIGTAQDSIFLQYTKSSQQPLERNRMVGDLLYSGFDSEGDSVPFSLDGQDVHFFSALRLQTLEELVVSSSVDREVLLIACKLDNTHEKHIAIQSALHKHRYASRLVLDDVTAKALINRIDIYR